MTEKKMNLKLAIIITTIKLKRFQQNMNSIFILNKYLKKISYPQSDFKFFSFKICS